MRSILATIALAIVSIMIAAESGAAEFPLKISADGKRFVDQNDVPFFINGDTPWSLIGQVSKEDAELYLADCAAKGINSLIVTLVEGFYADNAPANFYGVQPYLTPNKFSTPNDEYFEHADWVIRKAAEYGIQIILSPNYLGCCDDGWLAALRDDNSIADARAYGQYVGNRYKDFPNLMYSWGNDLNPGNVRDKIRAMAEATKAADSNHLHTYHAFQSSALDHWDASESWLDFNITYTYHAVQIAVLSDYNPSPSLPFFLFESQYENDFMNASAQQTRKQAYVAVLSGSSGHHHGNYPIWHMNGSPGDDGPDWKTRLDDEGRADVQHVGELFQSRAWYRLMPDQAHEFVTDGYGTGQNYVGAAVTDDQVTGIVYFPNQRSVEIDLDQVSGSEKNAWWFNPRDGSATAIDTADFAGSQQFSPPSSGDWVLVIDDAAANLAAPGTVVDPPDPPEPPPSPTRPLPPEDFEAR